MNWPASLRCAGASSFDLRVFPALAIESAMTCYFKSSCAFSRSRIISSSARLNRSCASFCACVRISPATFCPSATASCSFARACASMPRRSCSSLDFSASAAFWRRSASENSSAIFLRRASSWAVSGPQAHLLRPQSRSRKPRIWVPTMRMSIRFMRAPLAARAHARAYRVRRPRASDIALEEETGHASVDRERFGERRDDDHGELDLRGGLRLAADRLHGALADQAEADARADGGDADAERQTERKCGMHIHGTASWFS